MAANDNPKNKALPSGEDGAAAPPKSKLKRIIILLLILLIIGAAGGGGAYWWFIMRPQANPEAAAEASEGGEAAVQEGEATAEGGEASPRLERKTGLPRSAGLVLPLPPFEVNLSDPSGKRYLKIGMEVEVNKDVSAAIKDNAAKIRDAVIILLASKSYAEVSSTEGKILLKAEVGSRLNQILGGTYVVRIYFTDFVVN